MASLHDSRSSSPALSPISTPPSSPPELDTTSTVDDKLTPSSTTDYARWRPSFHLMPESGWMNDPCAPGYDPSTGNYLVSFQWNPKGPDWGEICWGTAISKDMCNWTLLEKPTLCPDTRYDGEGVFTGCLIPTCEDEGGEELTVAYTSVSHLPIHHTLPHVRGSESLSLARSVDGGKTWSKLAANPTMPSEPIELDVTGWRDPFVSRWPSMARTLNLDSDKTLFGIISGGIRDLTPCTFVYAIDASDLTNWRYIGPLVDVGLNKRLSRWSGDLGLNWEVTNFMTLHDNSLPSMSRDFLVMGTEGCLPAERSGEDNRTVASSLPRPERGQLWMSGTLRKNSLSTAPVEMTYDFGGHLDHGCLYAANSFHDPQSQKQVVWGWIPEDDLCDDLRHRQGWSGMLSLPRELRLQTIRHVVHASASHLVDLTSFEKEQDEFGTYTLGTLGSEPLSTVQRALREADGVTTAHLTSKALYEEGRFASFTTNDILTTRWELRCSIRLSSSCRATGFTIGHSADFTKATTLTFEPAKETITINRPSFSRPELVNSSPEVAPHTLFTTRIPASGREETETLDIQVWRDNSVMEVFVNGRTAISTRLYAAEETYGIRFFAEDGTVDDRSALVDATLWDGIGTSIVQG
ncbi:putative beta-Fructufuranosidase [Saxophila tyrrhenica]|uniref:Beta-Fructufuranosidase n=1 Tax=Saxophila tyrrhenica TaxID=1690608 RepID=A0AAV9PDL8_9PEZI|nr:putative beta-Fructufuranosidase [Saxophila tyrrhenica]